MASPSDPRCPACDGKVSATATWCMHCGRDLPDGPDGAERTDGGAAGLTGGPADDGSHVDRLAVPVGFPEDRRATLARGAVAFVVAAAALHGALGLSLTVTGAWLAVGASAAAVVLVWRRSSSYDAVRYGVWLGALVCVFVPFGLAAAEGGGDGGPVSVLLTLIPVTVAAVVAAGVGPRAPDFGAEYA